MKKNGKRLRKIKESYDKNKFFDLDEAIDLLKSSSSVAFDETVDISFSLNIDSRKSDQSVRVSFILPNGSGKTKRIMAFVQSNEVEEARAAGADYIGDQDFIKKIQKGWIQFEVVVADPSFMRDLACLGRFLGSRGLMPTPKNGTVTKDVVSIIKEIKKGRVDLRVDKNNDMHLGIALLSFDKKKIKENIEAVIDAVTKARPSTVKGQYIRQINLSSTMGPGIKVFCPK